MLGNFRKTVTDHPVLTGALLVTLLVYLRVLTFGHISWDDPEMVFRNKAVREFDLTALVTGHFVGMYLPLTMLLHAITWALFGANDAGHHLVSVVLHLLNGILVYRVAAFFFNDKKTQALTALVFLLHPLQLESVAWISELKNTLSASFYLASVLFYQRFLGSGTKKNYALAFALFIGGCLSKSSVVILPLTLICIDLYHELAFRARSLLNKIPFLLVSVLFGIINLKTQAADQFINYSHAFPYHERLGYAGFALFRYLTLFLVPHNLSVLYPYPSGKLAAQITGFMFIAALAFVVLRANKKKDRALIAHILLCVTSLLLVLQFVPFGEVLYADRYMYVPLVFFTMLTLFLLKRLRVNMNYPLYVAAAVLPVVTFIRMDVWKNSALLYSDILKKFPDSFVALNSLGAELMLQNRDKESLQYLNRSIKVSPYNYKGYYNRGLLYIKNNEPKKAIADFNEAIGLYDYHKAYIGRASAYYMTGDIPKAMKDATYVLEKQPRNAKALFILADCYNSMNQLDTAIKLYSQAIEVSGDEADFYFKRAIAYGKKQDFESSQIDLDICIGINPSYHAAYYWRGVAKAQLRKDPCEDFRKAAVQNIEPAVQAYNKYCR